MKSIVFSFAAAAMLAAGVAAQGITINTPTGATLPIQCQAYQVTWTGGTAPFTIRLLDAAQNYIETLTSNATASPLIWRVNEPAGQGYIFSIIDASGVTAASGTFIISTSSDSSCLSSPLSVTGSNATAPPASGSTSSASQTKPPSASETSPAPGSSGNSNTTKKSGASAIAAGVFAPVFAAAVALFA